MDGECLSTSLIEHLSESGYSASIIATYNCYFPFYEDVVLRRLIAAGCTHNILMMDAARCAEALASDDSGPCRAGRDYSLIPVATGGAFHPKLILRLGKARGALFVGSHNVTLSGFGLNDEITSTFRADGVGLRSASEPFRRALEFLARHVPTGLPDVVAAYEGVKTGVPWLDGPVSSGSGERVLLTASNYGPDLWSQLAPLMPRNVATAFVCGPFFDPQMAFIRRLVADVRPREAVIGIDPTSVEIDPVVAEQLAGIRFVNVAGALKIAGRRDGAAPYLHAKILWFRGADGELLVVGSANPSVAAFLAPSVRRNAEAVVADRRPGAGAAIGIDVLRAAPPVTTADWSVIAERRRQERMRGDIQVGRASIATPTAYGFLVQDPLPADLVFDALGEDRRVLGSAAVRGPIESTAIDASDVVRDAACLLVSTRADDPRTILVHRTEEIARHFGGDAHKALRQALGAIEDDPAQLETLLRLTEKVIFDADGIVRTTPVRTTDVPPAKDSSSAPASLAVDAAGRPRARPRTSFAGGDIVVLLDALIRRLAAGLSMASRDHSASDRSGAVEEDGDPDPPDPPDHAAIARICRGKVRRLITRMEAQLKNTAVPGARRPIVQLAAVLAVVRRLRLIAQRPEWRRARLELVEPADSRRLFCAATLALTWGPAGLAARALAEAGEPFEELSLAIGLLGWLAWDLGLEAAAVSGPRVHRDTEEHTWLLVQLFALLSPLLAGDPDAMAEMERGVALTPRPRVDGVLWLVVHLELAERLVQALTVPAQATRPVTGHRAGDLVLLGERFEPRIRVVLAVEPLGDDVKLIVFDADDSGGRRAFRGSRVAGLSPDTERGARVNLSI